MGGSTDVAVSNSSKCTAVLNCGGLITGVTGYGGRLGRGDDNIENSGGNGDANEDVGLVYRSVQIMMVMIMT